MPQTTYTKSQVKILIHKHDPLPTKYWFRSMSQATANPAAGIRVLDVSKDAVNCTTNMSIRGGTFSFTLVPAEPYLSLIDVDDVVNIYFKIKEVPIVPEADEDMRNCGWVRDMFGYVSSIDENVSVDGTTGRTTTTISVQGDWFGKAAEKTNIYFNPALQFNNRTDFGDNLAGLALMSQGVSIHGMPRHIIAALIQALMGFGGQWLLPPGYSDFLLGDPSRLGKGNDLLKVSRDLRDMVKKEFEGYFTTDASKIKFHGPNALREVHLGSASTPFDLNYNVWSGAGWPNTLADVMTFDYLDITSGFIMTDTIRDLQGSLLSHLIGYSNDPVNEFFMDLRPTRYPTYDPELMLNPNGAFFPLNPIVDGLGVMVSPGNVYTPAVVLRQYPFSYAESASIPLPLKPLVPQVKATTGAVDWVSGSGSSTLYTGGVGGFTVYELAPTGGDIFTVDLGGDIWNSFDRVFRRLPTSSLSIIDASEGFKVVPYTKFGESVVTTVGISTPQGSPKEQTINSVPYPILERMKITTRDNVDNSTIGKSDSDVVNVFGIDATLDILGAQQKYAYADLLPIPLEISIQRHGLREYIPSTQYTGIDRRQIDDRSGTIKSMVLQWAILMDHWHQHNANYLKGTISLKGVPALRVGYRLDWEDRGLSFYVESVSKQWSFQQTLQINAQVTRGQPSRMYNESQDGITVVDPKLKYYPPTIGQENLDRLNVGKSMNISHTRAVRTGRKYEGV